MRSVEELPPCFQPIFSSFKYFNGIQAEMLDFILSSARSFVVSAPTGSGKTVLLELAIVQMLMKHVDRATGAFNHKPGELKAILYAFRAGSRIASATRAGTSALGALSASPARQFAAPSPVL